MALVRKASLLLAAVTLVFGLGTRTASAESHLTWNPTWWQSHCGHHLSARELNEIRADFRETTWHSAITVALRNVANVNNTKLRKVMKKACRSFSNYQSPDRALRSLFG